jgi:hypothetical protein
MGDRSFWDPAYTEAGSRERLERIREVRRDDSTNARAWSGMKKGSE